MQKETAFQNIVLVLTGNSSNRLCSCKYPLLHKCDINIGFPTGVLYGITTNIFKMLKLIMRCMFSVCQFCFNRPFCSSHWCCSCGEEGESCNAYLFRVYLSYYNHELKVFASTNPKTNKMLEF